MKRISILVIIIGLLLVGCSQVEQIVASAPVAKESSETKMKRIALKESNEIAIFSTAVDDSSREPGIVNMSHPQYEFSLDEERYFLWISEDYGAIMNLKDSHTLYTLSTSSAKKVNEFVN